MIFNQKWIGGRFEFDNPNGNELFSVEVPGNIQNDYLKHIGVENQMYSDNLAQMEQTESWYWEYRTKLDFSATADETVWFVTEGIDYQYDIVLDGEKIESHTGTFSKVEIDITDKAKKNSLLQVIIYPHPKRPGNPIKMRSLADQCCKPAVHYGWDFNPQLLVSGLWKPIYIETRKSDYITDCEPFYELNDTLDSAKVRFETVCNGIVKYTVKDESDNIVYSGTDAEFELNNINLWWCNGHGKPYLYSWTAETADDIKTGVIGFKKIRLLRNGGAGDPRVFPKSRYDVPCTVELNGKRIFAKGTNLVNTDIYPGIVTKERYEELIDLAVDAHFNMFRLWGGAGIKKDEFYELCNKKGILIWQEFMLACNNYRGTKEYLSVLEQEAKAIIKHLRSNPCIALWCGGNELFNGWSGMTDQDAALRLLNSLCYTMDPERPFLMTSPLCGMGHGGYSFTSDGKDVFEIFQNAYNTAYTEFGMPSLADYSLLKQIIPADEIECLSKSKSWVYHDAFMVWGEYRWSGIDDIQRYFGELESTEEYVKYSQMMQCEGYKSIFEEARRQWPHCSMALNWCMNEPWITAANNSLISYPCNVKPAYYAVKNSLSPIVPSARIPKFAWVGRELFEAEIWMLNDSENIVNDEITITVEIDGRVYNILDWKTEDINAYQNKIGPTIHFTLPDELLINTFKLKLTTKNGYSNEYILNYKPLKKPVNTGRLNV